MYRAFLRKLLQQYFLPKKYHLKMQGWSKTTKCRVLNVPYQEGKECNDNNLTHTGKRLIKEKQNCTGVNFMSG